MMRDGLMGRRGRDHREDEREGGDEKCQMGFGRRREEMDEFFFFFFQVRLRLGFFFFVRMGI